VLICTHWAHFTLSPQNTSIKTNNREHCLLKGILSQPRIRNYDLVRVYILPTTNASSALIQTSCKTVVLTMGCQ